MCIVFHTSTCLMKQGKMLNESEVINKYGNRRTNRQTHKLTDKKRDSPYIIEKVCNIANNNLIP